MSTTRITRCIGAAALVGAALASASCGEVARTGQSPSFLIIASLEGASGAEPDTFGTVLSSDAQTLVEVSVGGQQLRVPTIFADSGRVVFRLGLKNPGLPTDSFGPSTLNAITVNRYRVTYRRADGRNTPGVDVPYAFDGAITVTVTGEGTTSAGFELVRIQAKQESPVINLVNNGGAQVISTIAEVVFWGRDQAGNEVMAVGSISVNFADWGDPD
jgi:hypothetical protein